MGSAGERKILEINGYDPILVVDQGVPYLAVIDQCVSGCYNGVSVLRYNEDDGEWQFLGDRGFTGDEVLRFDFAVVNGKPRVISLFDNEPIIDIWEWDGANWKVLGELDLSGAPGWDSKLIDVDLDRVNGTPYASFNDPGYPTLEAAAFDGQDWNGLPNLAVHTGNPDEWDLAIRDGVVYFAHGEYDPHTASFSIRVHKFEDAVNGWTPVGDVPFSGMAIDPRVRFWMAGSILCFTTLTTRHLRPCDTTMARDGRIWGIRPGTGFFLPCMIWRCLAVRR